MREDEVLERPVEHDVARLGGRKRGGGGAREHAGGIG
jgi:transposase-like protein